MKLYTPNESYTEVGQEIQQEVSATLVPLIQKLVETGAPTIEIEHMLISMIGGMMASHRLGRQLKTWREEEA